MSKSRLSPVRVVGPLQPYAAGFRRHLKEVGYTPLSAANLERVLAHVSRWLDARRLQPRDLSVVRLEQFLRVRRAAGYTCWRSMRGLAPMLEYLRRIEVVPPPPIPKAQTAVERFFDGYRTYLVGQRGLVATTIWNYVHLVDRFVTKYGGREADFSGLTAEEVTRFVVHECRRVQVGQAKLLVTALRSLLRYLQMKGFTSHSLAGAVPGVAGWRLTGLPRDVDLRVVHLLLESCDRRTAIGLRDYAALLLLERLGLRAGEVAALQLDDIDWRQAEIVVHGKGGQVDRLPLPEDVGEAVATYIRRGRAKVASRAIFLTNRAPFQAASSGVVTAIVRSACLRAEVPPFSAHRLRHTAATQMLRNGTPLVEVGQVLRHRSLQTTAIYAKVDRSSLGTLARPWPVVEPVGRSSLRSLAQDWPGGES
jgi:integrase/recombinase XerD